ncbi:ecdysteroid 22-kinase family protein [Sphingobium sufflavum]|uniref:ecdysteroid 22-kinase family protein n=1 Tax=Sphingobium sufflavum TaxID=1129547 RepID=UPI001F32CDFD|nr:ecdysteroid 22-kinase family protein [Sphingobium sufflavum]MCE7797937.1 ecdysteroid 22-kinase family protein [Sphingobium sufflavum]
MTTLATLPVPRTLTEALDHDWLRRALAPVTGGKPITAVETVEVIRTVATKLRFTIAFDGAEGGSEAFCLKGLLDVDAAGAMGGPVTVLECDFYIHLAPKLAVRVPDCVATVVDRDAKFGVVIMRDVVAQGGRFCSALDAFTADEAAQSLDQLALLHSGSPLLDELPWINRRVAALANSNYVTEELLQELLDGPRGEGLPAATRDAARLRAAMKVLAERDLQSPDFLIHGDGHAGNIFRTADGAGLIDWQLLQRGSWALDVAYHIAAVLPVEVAEVHERALLNHYLDRMQGLGVAMPDEEAAWAEYRAAAAYGYYLWGITRRVDPAIITVFTHRLGSAVTRHDSFALLGL